MPWTYISEVDAFSIYHQVREEQQDDTNTTQEGSFLPSLGHAVAGSIGTAISNLAVYPLDLVVTRLQVRQRSPALRSRNSTQRDEDGVGAGAGARAGDGDRSRDDKVDGTRKRYVVDTREEEEVIDGPPGSTPYASLPSAVRHIYHTEGGIPAFYAGITQDTIKSMADSFLFFLFYNLLLRLRRQVVRGASVGGGGGGGGGGGDVGKGISSKANATTRIATLLSRVLSAVGIGMLAGAATKGLTSPLQQVITLKKTSASSSCSTSSTSSHNSSSPSPSSAGIQNQSTTTILKHIYRTRGLRGFWAGYSASLVLTLNPSLTMAFHGFLDKVVGGRRGGGSTSSSGGIGGLVEEDEKGGRPSEALLTFILAATSKAAASCVMYPASVAKTRAQVDSHSCSPPYYTPGAATSPSASSSSSSSTIKSQRPPNQANPGSEGNNKNTSSVLLNIPQIANTEGIGALYAGLGGEMVKGFLAHGLTMVVKERVQGRLVGLWVLLLGVLSQRRRNGGGGG